GWSEGLSASAPPEVDLLDGARRLAERSLEQHPRNAAASHPLSHVFFESNDHAGGVGFLADWITEYDRAAPFYCHLSWHLALFELMQGHTDRVLAVYRDAISPSYGEARTRLVDAASLLWRYEMYDCQPSAPLPCAQASPPART